jgi:hypothetical protein
MTTAYNPFLVLDMPYLKMLLTKGMFYIVLQRFNWPGLQPGRAFIATAYKEQEKAQKHALNLEPNEGRLIDTRHEMEKFVRLFNDPDYYLFVSKFKTDDCTSKVIRHYHKNIAFFLSKKTSILPNDPIDINIVIEDGRVTAEVRSVESDYKFEVYDLIN